MSISEENIRLAYPSAAKLAAISAYHHRRNSSAGGGGGWRNFSANVAMAASRRLGWRPVAWLAMAEISG